MLYFCSVCEKRISKGVNDYSLEHFGKALCMAHQPKSQKAQEKKHYYCNECNKTITYAELKYSLKNFDKILCRGCQPIIEKTYSCPTPEYHVSEGMKKVHRNHY